jgi:CBS-domain-containing membrane protein
MKASQIMSAPLITVRPDTTILQAARHLVLHHLPALPVVDSQRHVVGIVREGDLLRARMASVRACFRQRTEYDESAPVFVKDIMHRDVVSVAHDDSLEVCIDVMARHHGGCLPVLRGGSLVGMITPRDILAALNRIGGGPGGDQSLRTTAGTGAIDLRTREAATASR